MSTVPMKTRPARSGLLVLLALVSTMALAGPASADGPPVITAGPAQGTSVRSTEALFYFEYGDLAPGQTFQCRLDGGDWTPCEDSSMPKGSHSYKGLLNGAHLFEVRRASAFSGDPLADETPTSRKWFADVAAPKTSFLKAPRARTSSRTARFFFAAEPGATFECSLDRAAFSPCAQSHTLRRLRPGLHRMRVRASDLVGNTEAEPAVHVWVVAAKRARKRV